MATLRQKFMTINQRKFKLPYSIDFSAGGLGRLSGSTWAIVGGKAVNTPTLGSELILDGGMENWISDTNLTSWSESLAGTSTINKEATDKHGGSFAARCDIDGSNSNAQVYQTVTLPVKNWFSVEYWRKASSGAASGGLSTSGGNISDFSIAPGTTWVKRANTGFVTTANPQLFFRVGSATSASLYYDDVTVKAITASSLFAVMPPSVALARVSASWIIESGSFAGVVMCLDSKVNPLNYVVLVHDGNPNKLRLIKCVDGTFTVVANVASTYVSGAPVELRHTATNTWQMFYNNAQVSTDQTISDAGIVSNTIHGAFSANGGSQLNSFLAIAS